MATAVARPSNTTKVSIDLPGSRYDHFFFSAMALAMLTTVFVGFAHTYYLAGVFSAPLPSLTIHLHGAAFSCWILLLVTQTSLVASGRTDIHRRLGIAGFLLACLMVVLGVLAATDSLVRVAGPAGRDAKFFYIVPLTDMLIFATLILFAFRAPQSPGAQTPHHGGNDRVVDCRHRPLADYLSLQKCCHSRVIVLHLPARPGGLRPLDFAQGSPGDWAGGFLIFVQQIRIPIGKTAAWHAVASWVQYHAR